MLLEAHVQAALEDVENQIKDPKPKSQSVSDDLEGQLRTLRWVLGLDPCTGKPYRIGEEEVKR